MPGINLTRDEAAERAAHLAVASYDVTLDLTTGPEVFRSTTVLRFSSSLAGLEHVRRPDREAGARGRA
nr:hypothetical protein [Angustibacter aerolatus]